MKLVKKTAEYSVYLRRDGRHAVRSAKGKWINGDDKVAALQEQGLLKKPEPKPEAPKDEAEAETPEEEAQAE